MRPRLQLALDMPDLEEALRVTQLVADSIDVIEVGTLLCLAEGMHAVRAIRKEFPSKTIVGDVRIARAGKNIAQMTFDAGADWVSAVAEAPYETIAAAAEVAKTRDGELQIELDENNAADDVDLWRELGIGQVIFHATSEVGTVGGGPWTQEALSAVSRMAGEGFRVTVTGGITEDAIATFAGTPVFVFIAGRAICQADDPAAAARRFQDAIGQTYG